jgi:Zn-dependent protease
MSDLTRFLPSWVSLLVIPGLIAGFTVHELAHACVAYRLGDRSQVARGRISFNPLRHVFWLGMITFVLFGFGWARPIRMDMTSFRRRYLGLLLVSVAGALANLMLALLCVGVTLLMVVVVAVFSSKGLFEVLRMVAMESPTEPGILAWTSAFTTYAVYANLAMAFFNLLPLPGLDGFGVLVALFGLAKGSPEPAGTAATGRPVAVSQSRGESARLPADIHFEHGAEYHATGNYADAIARYRQAIASNQHHGPAYVNLGLAYVASGLRERAIHAFRGATQFAADEQSRREAWVQLHKLSQFSPVAVPSPPSDVTSKTAAPWGGANTVFNWSAFWGSGVILLAALLCVYTYLTIALIGYFA